MSEQTALPCWYELRTTDPGAAADFYTAALGLTVVLIEGPGFDYRIASDSDSHGVAGLTDLQGDAGPHWLTYFAVTDCDAKAAEAVERGGTVLRPPADIPGTGRFAVLADPQGAVFALLHPQPQENPAVGAFDQTRPGHGTWHDLSTSDPEAALAFYSALFGWSAGQSLDMGEHGNYLMFNAGDTPLGGINGLLGAPRPNWLPYFGVQQVDATVETVTSAGGSLTHGPAEVPDGSRIAHLTDAQGAAFGIVGH